MTNATLVEFHCLDPERLSALLELRRLPAPPFPAEFDLADNLVEVLRKANQFVPSAAGSILLDDPLQAGARSAPDLTFIAAFGAKSEALVGMRISSEQGIAGKVYRSGQAHLSIHAASDPFFLGAVDEQISYQTCSLVAIPIRIEGQVCGVLELVNREGADGFSEHDKNLLTIFADYISVSIQNMLDGRRAQEIAKRDNLTGLYNDRFLHVALSQAVAACSAARRDLAVLFLDLDFFKRVNDTFGHLAGSQVLREVGELLRRKTTHLEAIAARYGGDEFVLVLPGMDLDAAVDLAEDVRAEILETSFCSEPGEIFPETLNLHGQTCSIGIATLAQHIREESSLERIKGTLLRLADAAMYVAKETGRNRTAVAGSPVKRREIPPNPS